MRPRIARGAGRLLGESLRRCARDYLLSHWALAAFIVVMIRPTKDWLLNYLESREAEADEIGKF